MAEERHQGFRVLYSRTLRQQLKGILGSNWKPYGNSLCSKAVPLPLSPKQPTKSHWHRPSMAAGYNKPPASIGLDLGHAPARVYWLPATGYGHGHSYHKVAIAVLSCPPALLSIQVRLSNYQLTNNYNIWIWPMGLSDSSWVTELNYSTTKG